MTDLHVLEVDQAGKLVLHYEKENNEWWFRSFFEDLAGFEEKDLGDNIDFVCEQMQEKSAVIQNIREIKDAFEAKLGAGQLVIKPSAQKLSDEGDDEDELFEASREKGREIKQSGQQFNPQLSENFRKHRELKPYQKMSVEHMIQVKNVANFSVPGSGKTTMTYAALSKSLEDKTIEKILVIGPTSSFVPWQEEWELCFGKPKKSAVIVRGDYARDFSKIGDFSDLFLMHFQTAWPRIDEIKLFFQKWKTALIIDESHNIKSPNLEKKWNTMALSISKEAKKRIVLSGTPMPKNEKDLWTQITCLWPNSDPLDRPWVYKKYVEKEKKFGKYQPILDSLFTRVTKDDLGLPGWNFIPKPIPLGKYQRQIYDAVATKILKELEELKFSDRQHLHRLRRARLIRLLQVASNPQLIHKMSGQFNIQNEIFAEQFGLPKEESDAELLGRVNDLSLSDKIKNYEELGEIPSKISFAANLAKKEMKKGKKVIIWNSFIDNMTLFETQILKDVNPIIVNGTVRRQTDTGVEKWKEKQRVLGLNDKTREERVEEFKNDEGARVLIASAASLGESVSLHQNLRGDDVCSTAIYLDRNFNAAQFMQSVDRIHRIGVTTEPDYYLLIGERTIDEEIDRSLKAKWENMLKVLNDPLLKRLGLDAEAETVAKEEIDSIDSELVKHLKKYFS